MPSPLVHGSLEIPIEVTVQWEDDWAMEILRRLKKLTIPLGKWINTFKDQLKNILNSILREELSDLLYDSDCEALIEELQCMSRQGFAIEIKVQL